MKDECDSHESSIELLHTELSSLTAQSKELERQLEEEAKERRLKEVL